MRLLDKSKSNRMLIADTAIGLHYNTNLLFLTKKMELLSKFERVKNNVLSTVFFLNPYQATSSLIQNVFQILVRGKTYLMPSGVSLGLLPLAMLGNIWVPAR